MPTRALAQMPLARRHAWLPGTLIFIAVAGPASSQGAQPGGCSAAAPGVASGAAPSSLDTVLARVAREHGVPGAAVAVVRDGATVFLGGFGCADLERSIPVDPRGTVFRVASVSKLFVATAAAQLAERGAVDLDADVNRYLRGVRVPEAFGAPVTMRQLLTHTAGFDERVVGYAARTAADVRPLGEFLASHLPRRGWPPGEITGYSNFGYALAGYVVESVAGTRFSDYAAREILAPLVMPRSTYEQPPPPSIAASMARGYRCTDAGCTPLQTDFRSAYPPGGLLSTAEDMSHFMLVHLEGSYGGARILGDSARRMMHARHFSHDAAIPGMALGFAEDELHGHRALSHAGGSPGFASLLVLVPERRFGVFFVTNGGSSRFGRAALTAIAEHFLGPPPSPPPTPKAAVDVVDPSGSYRLTRYAHRGVENLPALFLGRLSLGRGGGDTLLVAGLGDADGPYLPVAPTRWRRIGGTEQIAVRTIGGRATHAFGPLSYFGARTPAAYERLAWFDTPGFVNEALSYLLMVPLLTLLVAWPVAAFVHRLLRRRSPAAIGGPRRTTPRIALAVAAGFTALAATFGFGFIARTVRAAERGGGDLIYGLSPMTRLLAWAPLVLALLAVVLAALSVTAWRRRWWDVARRALFSVLALCALLFAALLGRWGYLPTATWWS